MAESLGRAVFDIDLNLAGFRQGLGQVLQQAKQAGTGIQSALSANKGTLAALDIRINSLKEEIRLVEIGSQKYKELAAEIRKATTERTKADAAQGGGIGASLGQGLGGLAAAAGIGVGIAGVATALKGAVDAAVELDNIGRKLQNTLGPSGAAGALDFTRKLSDELGLSFVTLSDSFGSFTAAASAAGVPLEQQKQLFAAVSKAGQSLGLSNDALNGSFQALQQIASKGVVSMEELRGQLGERLPIALTAAANGLGVSQKELIGLVESGRLAASDFFPAFTKGLNDLTKGAGGTRTAAQAFQALQNSWTDLQTELGNSALPIVVKAVDGLAGALKFAATNVRTLIAVTAGISTAVGLYKLLTGAVNAAAAAQKALAVATAIAQAVLNPASLGKVAIAIAGGAAAAVAIDKALQGATASQQGLGKATDDTKVKQLDAAAKQQQALAFEIKQQSLLLGQKAQALQLDATGLKATEQRLGFYAQEYNLVGQIEKVRSDAALNRSNTVKSLLDQELQQAQALAGSDEERARLQQVYGKAKLDQTITEFRIKGDGLRSELASQEASLEFERQKSAAAAQRAVVEAQIEQIKAQQKALSGGPEAQKELELANQLVGIAQDAYSQELRLGGLRSQLFQEQKAAAAERLSNERLVALNSLEAYGTDQQRAQIQADVNRQLQNTVQYSSAASVAAGQFKQELQGASQARGDLATAFQAQVTTTIDGSQQFSQMNTYLSTIATNTAKPPTVNVTVNNSGGGCGGNSSASVKASGRS